MQLRPIVIAALIAAPAMAETPKSAPPQASASQQAQPKAVVFASAEAVKPDPSGTAQAAPAQTRHRIARVTTCRCGDPAPVDVADEPQQ